MKDTKHLSQTFFYSEIFVRLTSAIFLFAFIDSFVQYKQVIGEQSAAPITDFLVHARQQFVVNAIWRFPSLFWISSSDFFLTCIFILGSLASLITLIGRFQIIGIILSFVCWLSIVNTGSDFFLYIWDTLLLEAGFIGIIVSFHIRYQKHEKLTQTILFLFAFRLWFSMGIVTVLYNTSVEMNGSFIHHFLQNQPMPSALAFYVYHLPSWVHALISTFLLLVELLAPLLIFHKRTRAIAFFAFVLFSCLVFLIGNYAWFNILSIVISIPLLINTSIGQTIFEKLKQLIHLREKFSSPLLLKSVLTFTYIQIVLQSFYLVILFFPTGNRFLNFLNYPNYQTDFIKWKEKNLLTQLICTPLDFGANFKLANPYGVFKGIPIKRWEIEFELCNDTLNGPLKKLNYYYKPGLSESSGYFAPHHPRLEQQLFYEAQQGSFYLNYTPYQNKLNDYCWTKNYVLNMLNTTNNQTYKFVRLNIVELSFNTKEEYKITGTIWKKTKICAYTLNNKFIPCPLIPAGYFKTFAKHQAIQ